ncbi:MAG: tetratricopeptide repeat protein [Cyanobacteria bacterium TGS_CYA1]|nr:tetratricopeptide repeat protein [Cyanobacteria bacterium TGS_CYA1]
MHKKLILSAIALTLSFTQALAFTSAEKPEYDLLRKKAETLTFAEKDLVKLEAFIAKYPHSAELTYLLGRYLEQNGYESLAADAYSRSSNLDPNFLSARFHRLISLLKINNEEDAKKELNECMRLLKSNPGDLAKLALLLESGGHFDLAQRVYEVAADAPSAVSELSVTVAELRFRQYKLTEAMSALEIALRKNPKDRKALFLKGKILCLQGKTEPGMQAFQQLYEVDPCHEGVSFIIARNNLRLNHSDKALLAGMVAMMCYSKDQHQFNEAKKQVELSLRNLTDAESKTLIEAFATQLSSIENRVFFRFSIGDVFDRLGKFDSAINQYQLGVQDSKSLNKDFAPLLARGLFRWAKDEETHRHDFQKALHLYDLANQLTPYDQEITSNQYRLSLRVKNVSNDPAFKFKMWLRELMDK